MKLCILSKKLYKKLLQTRMHSSRMRTARSSSRPGGLHQAPPGPDPPGPGTPPGTRHPPGSGPPPPPVNRITDTCKNITFPQLRLWAVIKSESKADHVGKNAELPHRAGHPSGVLSRIQEHL